MMTPNDIDVLLHYYCSNAKHPRADAPAVQSATQKWVAEGMFKYDMANDTYNTTHRATVLVKMLCDTPMPMKAWTDPRVEGGCMD